MHKFIATILASVVIAACGGGGTAPAAAVTPAPVSTPPAAGPVPAPASAAVEVERLHCIIRPNSAGQWYVQNDTDHSPSGCALKIEQGADYLRVFFLRTYTHAGTVQITGDDDFNVKIQGFASLALDSATIRVYANGQMINPANVYSYIPQGGGNFWLNVTMMNK